MKKKDVAVINALREGARRKLSELAEDAGLPLSTFHERLQRLVKQKVIRLTSIPGYNELRMPLQSWMFIQTKEKDAVKDMLEKSEYANTVLVVNNGVDIVAECVFPHFKAQHEYMERLGKHGKILAYPVIEEIGREKAVLLE